MKKLYFFVVFIVLNISVVQSGILQPRASETREVVSLDGLWYFTTNSTFSFDVAQANDLDINLMPVPSSYNDITTRDTLRDHVGPVWYERKFYVPSSWESKRVWIRFGSVCYNASVEINHLQVLSHEIGHLPFGGDISEYLHYGEENVITVVVNNILTQSSIPQGQVTTLVSGREKQTYTFDFFSYAGIDRPVVLYTTSNAYVDDITIHTTLNGTTGIVAYDISVLEGDNATTLKVSILDKDGIAIIFSLSGNSSGTMTIPDANLWWPYLMDPNPGYQYALRVNVYQNGVLVDRYNQPFGVRELTYDNTSFKINGKKIYIRGFGRHEDSDIRGKGLDLPLIIRDHNLIKWIGANAYRTSHYPYAEEIMDLADRLGIMIIDEVPAVNTENFNDNLLENHKKSLTQLYHRDKNRPSVVVWSVANEPRTQAAESEEYYRHIVAHIKSFDKSRPVTICNMYSYNDEHSGQFLDILSFNRYQAWYNYVAEIDGIYTRIVDEAKGWHNLHNKPVLVSEYGADTLEGYHSLPSFIWSEEFQQDLMREYFRAFDELRDEGWFIGELIWNFADFKTDQAYTRVGGNKKGIFTRNRQPKDSAFLLRKRYWALAQKLDNATLPDDLEKYIINQEDQKVYKHNEL